MKNIWCFFKVKSPFLRHSSRFTCIGHLICSMGFLCSLCYYFGFRFTTVDWKPSSLFYDLFSLPCCWSRDYYVRCYVEENFKTSKGNNNCYFKLLTFKNLCMSRRFDRAQWKGYWRFGQQFIFEKLLFSECFPQKPVFANSPGLKSYVFVTD